MEVDFETTMGNRIPVLEAKSPENCLDQFSLTEWLPSDASYLFENTKQHSSSPANVLFSHVQLLSQNSLGSFKSSSFHNTTTRSISRNTSSGISRNTTRGISRNTSSRISRNTSTSVSRSTSGSSSHSGTYPRNSSQGRRKVAPSFPARKSYLGSTSFSGWHIWLPARPSAATSPKKIDSPKEVKEQKSPSRWAASLWFYVSACKRCHGLEPLGNA